MFSFRQGAHTQVALISQTGFEQLATATGDHQTLEVIHRANSANLHPLRFAEISGSGGAGGVVTPSAVGNSQW